MSRSRRGEVIELLRQLGAQKDEDVLAAARALNQTVTESGWTWDELLVPDNPTASNENNAEKAMDSGLMKDQQAPSATHEVARDGDRAKAVPAPDDQPWASEQSQKEVLLVLERLLARKDISEETRSELAAFRGAIEKGQLDPMDAEYLRALAKRLRA